VGKETSLPRLSDTTLARVTLFAAIPAPPADSPRSRAKLYLRFEDVTQDGRLVLEALPNSLGPTLWQGIFRQDPGTRACFENGVFPIVSRFVLEGTAGPFSAYGSVEAEGTYRIAQAEDGRFMLDMWADLFARIGHTHDRRSRRDEPRQLAGRVYGEHVYTRPFAPAGERRVTAFDFPGAPVVRETRPSPPAFEAVASLPAGAAALEPAPRVDPTPITFGICHTDGNMHVNSLAYLRVFEEAALRRFVELGRGSALLARTIEIAYRKPCFAGQAMRVVTQAFEQGGKLGVVARLVDARDASDPAAYAKAHVFVRLGFES